MTNEVRSRWSFRAQRAEVRTLFVRHFVVMLRTITTSPLSFVVTGGDAVVEQRILLSLGPPVAVLRLRRNAVNA